VTDSHWSRSARARLALLLSRSPMRRRIVVLLLEGRSRKAIAVELQRSQHTIDSHLKAMYHAIGVGDRAQLMLMAQGLIGPEDLPPPEMGCRHTANVRGNLYMRMAAAAQRLRYVGDNNP